MFWFISVLSMFLISSSIFLGGGTTSLASLEKKNAPARLMFLLQLWQFQSYILIPAKLNASVNILMNCKFSHYKRDMMLVLSHLSASRQLEDNICVCSLNVRVFGGSSFPRVIRQGCCQAARGSQQELTFTTPRHTSQTPVSLKHSLCGRPNINGDIDIFRQRVYLMLTLSNRSQ